MLDSESIYCPYCGEKIDVLIEPMDSVQTYYEDCQVCCQPIYMEITPGLASSTPQIRCLRADETP